MNKTKNSFYKQWWFILIVVLFSLGVIGEILDDGDSEEIEEVAKIETPVVKDVVKKRDPVEVVKPSIDTSVFEYATYTEVTDAIKTNQHVTVKVIVSEENKPGMAVQSVINQTFDFIQQEDVKDAKTITIFVTQNDKKIAQYTVQMDKFIPNETDPMSDLVLKASEIEMMSDEVKEFGAALGSW